MSLAEAQDFVNRFNADYEAKHEAFERQFWGTKMALSDTDDIVYSAVNLSQTKMEMEDLLSDPKVLKKAEELRSKLTEDPGSDVVKALDIIIRTCRCYDMSSAPEAKKIREETAKIESKLEMARNGMKLGYTHNGTFHEASSVGLRNLLRSSPDEDVRKAAHEGLKSIGPFVLDNGFVEIIKLRNKLAKSLGFIDYYDYKVTNAEGFGKIKLFEMLDELERGTKPLQNKARQELVRRFGEDATKPWNTTYMMAGDVVLKMNPYFPFATAVDRYVRSYAALGIKYEGSTMNLDLLDRPKKYSNGFCHWPRPAWKKPDGSWQPAVTNFTSLADPATVGSGKRALETLMHEAGHAAHFANIKQCSPLFSQERAPTSVAYAENQSMFLDSLVGDVDWRVQYARDKEGKPMPFEIIEEETRSVHPFKVFELRRMLAVSYFEKALYELPEEEVTAASVIELASRVENELTGGPLPAPLLCIPHLISDEASCYYHGYTLALMSVHQTRAFFKERDGYIVDNPKVGPTLTKAYWECGNSRPFLELVKELTGKDLSGAAWVAVLQDGVDEKVERERKEYADAVAKVASESPLDDVDLDMTVKFVDGDEVIADSSQLDGGILEACKKFEVFVDARVAAAS